jgi:hypothetical protein
VVKESVQMHGGNCLNRHHCAFSVANIAEIQQGYGTANNPTSLLHGTWCACSLIILLAMSSLRMVVVPVLSSWLQVAEM